MYFAHQVLLAKSIPLCIIICEAHGHDRCISFVYRRFLTLALFLFSTAPLFFFGRLSPVTEVDEGLFCVSLVCTAAAGTLWKIVGITSGFNCLFFFSPKEDANKLSTSKQS